LISSCSEKGRMAQSVISQIQDYNLIFEGPHLLIKEESQFLTNHRSQTLTDAPSSWVDKSGLGRRIEPGIQAEPFLLNIVVIGLRQAGVENNIPAVMGYGARQNYKGMRLKEGVSKLLLAR
jgi:hypothetical protein